MYNLQTFTFSKGSHKTREDGMCVNEAAALLAGEEHSASPKCVDPVISRLALWVNDSCDDALRNELLRDMPWRMVGTKSTREVEQQRAYMAADWAVRVVCPILFRRAGLNAEADKLADLPAVDSAKSARVANAAAIAAHTVAANVASAASAAKAANVASVASVAAEAAANVVASAASAANYATANLVASAAEAVGILEVVQRSCVELIDRMIRLTEPQEVVVSQRASKASV